MGVGGSSCINRASGFGICARSSCPRAILRSSQCWFYHIGGISINSTKQNMVTGFTIHVLSDMILSVDEDERTFPIPVQPVESCMI